jgi:hypothetical protein
LRNAPTNCMSNGDGKKAGPWSSGWTRNDNWPAHQVNRDTDREGSEVRFYDYKELRP